MTPALAAATAPDIAVFVVGALLVLGGALGVVLSTNPVRAALSLVLTLIGIGVLFVAQEAHFLFAVQIIVYAGAIVVLFLFVIMLLGVDQIERSERGPLRAQRPFGLLFGVAVAALVVALGYGLWDAKAGDTRPGSGPEPASNVERLADVLFTEYLFAFETTSILLVIAVVAAVYLARRSDAGDRHADLGLSGGTTGGGVSQTAEQSETAS